MHYLYGNSDRCQPCVRCMEGVRYSEGPLWEVPLYIYNYRSEEYNYCQMHELMFQVDVKGIPCIKYSGSHAVPCEDC